MEKSNDPLKYFRLEGAELFTELFSQLHKLKKGVIDPSLKNLLRHAHTLKGAARIVGQGEISRLTHSLEEIFGPFGKKGELPPPEKINLGLEILSQIGKCFKALGIITEQTYPTPANPQITQEGDRIFNTLTIPVTSLLPIIRDFSRTKEIISQLKAISASQRVKSETDTHNLIQEAEVKINQGIRALHSLNL